MEQRNYSGNEIEKFFTPSKNSGFEVVCNIINSHEDAALFCDDDYIIRYCNQACIVLAGGNDTNLVGKNLFNSFPDTIFKNNVGIISKTAETGELCKFDCKIKNNSDTFYDCKIEGGRFDNGFLFKIHKEQSKKNLNQTNFKMLFENMTSGFMYLKPVSDKNGNVYDHIVLDVNSAFEILFDIDRDKIVNKSIKIIDPDFDIVWIKRFGRTAQTGHSYSGKFLYHLLNKYYEFKSYSSEKGYTAVIINDMQAQLDARNELMVKSEISKAFAIGNSISLYKIILDLILKHTDSDKGFLGYIDENSQKLYCMSVCGNIKGEDIPDDLAQDYQAIIDIKSTNLLNECITQQQAVECEDTYLCGEYAKYSMTLPIINDDKTVGIISISNSVGNYTNKEKNFIISLANYIASMMAAEIKERNYKRQIIAEKERAERNEKLKTAFLANMSHEIRTPLNSILGFAEILTKCNNLTQKQLSYTEIIYKSGNQLLSIVEDIIDVSKIQTMQVKIRDEEVELNDVLAEVFDKNLQWAEEKHLNLVLTKGVPDGQSKIIADRAKLKKIVHLLVNNAIKFTNKGGVKYGYTIENDKIKFYVSDTGIGIRKELHQEIFNSFQQVENILERKYNGVGIGLTISKGFLDCMGGKIWLDSEPEKGSTFYFVIDYKPVKK